MTNQADNDLDFLREEWHHINAHPYNLVYPNLAKRLLTIAVERGGRAKMNAYQGGLARYQGRESWLEVDWITAEWKLVEGEK